MFLEPWDYDRSIWWQKWLLQRINRQRVAPQSLQRKRQNETSWFENRILSWFYSHFWRHSWSWPCSCLCIQSSRSWCLFFCISQCQGKTRNEYWDYINRTMQIVMVGYFIINVVLFICLFIIRNVSSVFSARQELKQVVAVLVVAFGVEIASLLYLDETMYVVMGYFLYVNLLASVTCLYLTALGPIRNTYKTSSIIPFSLN